MSETLLELWENFNRSTFFRSGLEHGLLQKDDQANGLRVHCIEASAVMETPSSLSTDTMNRFTSRLAFFGNDFPSGNIPDLFRRLHRWSKDKKFHVLALFMEESVATLIHEMNHLSQRIPSELTSAQNILGFVDGWGGTRFTPVGGAIETALLCILQLGILIG